MTLSPILRAAHVATVLAIVLGAPGARATDAASTGRPLAEALRDLEAEGLRIIFSDGLVRPEMIVIAAPDSGRPEERLAEILRPYRLAARPGPQGSWLVVPQSDRHRLSPGGDPRPKKRLTVFPSRIDGVDLHVTVTRQGQPVLGLTASDFEVRDNGVPQHVELIADECGDRAPPVQVVLVLDHSDSVKGRQLVALKAAATRLLGALGTDDAMSLVSFATTVAATPAGADRGHLLAPIEGIPAAGVTALYDGVYVALKRAAAAPPARSIVLVLSDGDDTGSWLSAADVLELARQSDVTIYGIETRREPGESAFLRDLAQATGGVVWPLEPDRELPPLLARIVHQARMAYRLRYEPQGVRREGVHDISVKLAHGEGDVRARRTYALPSEEEAGSRIALEATGISDVLGSSEPTAGGGAGGEDPVRLPMPTALVLDRPLCRGRTETPRTDEYEDVLGLYLDGHTEEASASLGSCTAPHLGPVLGEMIRDASLLPLAAAAHTESALRLAAAGDGVGFATQLELVESLVSRRLRRIDGWHRARQKEFWQRWLLALGAHHQSRGERNHARGFFGLAVALFPDDASAWLAAGTVDEAAAAEGGGDALTRRLAAEKRYRGALLRDPTFAEAHLRLGRVLQERGRGEEAESHLAWVTDHGRDPFLVALAWLFRGASAESRDDRAEAMRAYQFAFDIAPDLQPALLGLSHVLHRAGFAGLAGELLAAGIPAPDADAAPSPWREYHRGVGRTADDALRRWREEADRMRTALRAAGTHVGRIHSRLSGR